MQADECESAVVIKEPPAESEDEDHQGPGTAIYDVTDVCSDALGRLVEAVDAKPSLEVPDAVSPHESPRDIRGLRNSFAFWIDYTGALASAGASLDDRLHGHDEIKEMVMELLEMVERNLHRLEQNMDKNMSLSNVESQVWVTAIHSALDRLHFLASAIRKASATRKAQGRFHFVTDEDKLFHSMAISYVKWKCPSARPSLRDHMGDCITERRQAMLQKHRHAKKLKTRRTRRPPSVLRPNQTSTASIERSTTNPAVDYSTRPTPASTSGSKATQASEMDGKAVMRHILRKPALSARSSGYSQDGGTSTAAEYPNPPKIKPGETHIQCPYCFQALPVDRTLHDPKNRYWRSHVDQDLQPYVCLFRGCNNSLFAHQSDWVEHMATTHSREWPRKVHSMTWYCDLGHQEPVMFDNEKDWRQHMRELSFHPGRSKPPTDAQLDALSTGRQKLAPRDAYVCPFCEEKPQPIIILGDRGNPNDMETTLMNHIAGHVRSLLLLSLPSLGDEAAQDDGQSSETENSSGKRQRNSGSPPQLPSGDAFVEDISLTFDSDHDKSGPQTLKEFTLIAPISHEYVTKPSEQDINSVMRTKVDRFFTSIPATEDDFSWGNLALEQKSLVREKKMERVLKHLDTSPFREQKDRIPNRAPGTCEWFLRHENFQQWRDSESSTLLWVTAAPGCGKSVLVKHLVDSILPTTDSTTISYFLFSNDFFDQSSVASAFCCILYQLFIQKRTLLSRAVLRQLDAKREELTSSFDQLWEILISVAEKENAGEIICILDAIDECEDRGRIQLLEALSELCSAERGCKLKFLITSRPSSSISRILHPPEDDWGSRFLSIALREMPDELALFVQARLEDFRARFNPPQHEMDLLLQQLKLAAPNWTFLWLKIVLDSIESEIELDESRMTQVISHLPRTVDEVYDRMLAGSNDFEATKKVLHIALAAERPLTLREMAVALAIQKHHRSYHDLDPEPEGSLRRKLRKLCGLFVTIIDSKIYLFHPTAKEFLVQNGRGHSSVGGRGSLHWKHSLLPHESQRILAEICIRYLLLTEFETHPLDENGSLSQYVESYQFLDYSARHWVTHVHVSGIENQDTPRQVISRICDTRSRRCFTWFRVFWVSQETGFPKGFTTLMIASYFGLSTVLEDLVKTGGIELNLQDETHGRSALSWAAENGFDGILKALIECPDGARLKLNLMDNNGRTPLSYAAASGNVASIKLLIEAGAGTPLSYAISTGNKHGIELLTKEASRVPLEDVLFFAAAEGDAAVVRLLLEKDGVSTETKDRTGMTPLLWACVNGCEAVVEVILNTGEADVNARDNVGWTALIRAAGHGYDGVVKLLIATGRVDINAADYDGWTALLWAALNGHGDVVKVLLDSQKADINVTDNEGWTPLIGAANNGHQAVVQLLLKRGGANIKAKDKDGQTALSRAHIHKHHAIVQLLLNARSWTTV